MLLKYLDGPTKIVRWGNTQKDFLFRPMGKVPDEFGKLILAKPEIAGRFEEVKEVQTQAETVSPTVFACDICQRPLKSKGALGAHKRIHKEPKEQI